MSIPKNLQRLIALDRELAYGDHEDGNGVNLKHFAKRWKVDVATVRRDLQALKELGAEVQHRRPYEGSNYVTWGYVFGSVPLFTINYREPNNRLFRGPYTRSRKANSGSETA